MHLIIVQGCRFFIGVILTSDWGARPCFRHRYLELDVELGHDSQRPNNQSILRGCATGENQKIILWCCDGGPGVLLAF
jgi:hypothetical protein